MHSISPRLRRTLFFCLLLAGALSSCSDTAQSGSNTSIIGTPTPNELKPIRKFPGYNIRWSKSVPSPSTLFESEGLAANGRLYVFGGYHNKEIEASRRAYAFDPEQQRWYNLAPLPEAITHAGQALYGGKIYLAGGFVGDHPGPSTANVWIYDIANDAWSAGPALPEKLGGGALVELEGRLHFFGGTFRKDNIYLRDSPHHWVLGVAAGSSWVPAAPLPRPRNHIAGASLGGKLYAIGGQHLGEEDTGNSQIVQVYHPRRDSWQSVARLPRPPGHISAATFVYAKQIFVVGGVTEGRAKLSEVIAYDPQTNSWGKVHNMLEACSATVAGIIGGKIVLSTGNIISGPLDTTWIGSWKSE